MGLQRKIIGTHDGNSSSYEDSKNKHPGKRKDYPQAEEHQLLEPELKPETLRLLVRFVVFVGAVVYSRAAH